MKEYKLVSKLMLLPEEKGKNKMIKLSDIDTKSEEFKFFVNRQEELLTDQGVIIAHVPQNNYARSLVNRIIDNSGSITMYIDRNNETHFEYGSRI